MTPQILVVPCFKGAVDDPREAGGLRHRIESLLALCTAATLCGATGWKSIHEWIQSLSPAMLDHFRCRKIDGVHQRPSIYCIRNIMTKVDPDQLARATARFCREHGWDQGAGIAVDGKTICGAVDDEGRQTHVLGASGQGLTRGPGRATGTRNGTGRGNWQLAGDTGGAPKEKAEGDSVGRETSQPWNGIAVNLKELSNLGGIVAAATAISLCASIAYDWGYFRALGIAFGEAPTSIADHARTGLIVLPGVAVAGIGLLLLELFTRRVEDGMSEEELVSSSADPERTAMSRVRPARFIFWTAVVGGLMWAFLGVVKGLFLAVPVLWFAIMSWVFRHPRLGNALPKSLMMAIFWAPPIFVCLHLYGYAVARSDYMPQPATHRIHVVSASLSNGPFDGQLMRAFGQWNLVKDLDGNMAWLSQQVVRRIDLLQEHAPFPGLLCRIWDWPFCGEVPR